MTAAQALAKRHLPLRAARDVVERLLSGEEIAVELPLLENFEALERELGDLGVRAILGASARYSASAAFSR